ncbi:MAG: gamma-glutamylcyclotransferase [Gammaproteobacteria bacterium]|nr:gamma-glutamylcyclotransferase [Gammaproteobacteria bacterium]
MDDLWIFGYGSIMWSPLFAYQSSASACVNGWERKFWQESTDHRGTKDFPGRVVTITPKNKARCWGVAFRIANQDHENILLALDEREKNGYRRLNIEARLSCGAVINGITYIAGSENPFFSPCLSPESIANQIKLASGPSGSNVEYIMLLSSTLRVLGIYDHHVEKILDLIGENSKDENH